jgi:hypothetical protein
MLRTLAVSPFTESSSDIPVPFFREDLEPGVPRFGVPFPAESLPERPPFGMLKNWYYDIYTSRI